jgi:hypothetical protein
MFAGGTRNGKIHVWRIDGKGSPARRASASKIPVHELAIYWAEFGARDAHRAFRAIQILATTDPEDAVGLLRKGLRQTLPEDSEQIAAWIRGLDSPQFAVRTKATEQLESLGDRAEAAMSRALAANPSAEAHRRLEQLFQKLDANPSVERLRRLRAIEALERIATKEAAALLRDLAQREPGTRLEQEAKATLGRIQPQDN